MCDSDSQINAQKESFWPGHSISWWQFSWELPLRVTTNLHDKQQIDIISELIGTYEKCQTVHVWLRNYAAKLDLRIFLYILNSTTQASPNPNEHFH